MAADTEKAPGRPLAGQATLGQAATRRMCAGVYVDHAFRDKLLRGIYNEMNKRVAPSYGFDIVVVLRCAWHAWWLELGEHLALVAFLALVLVHAPFDTIIAVSVLAIWAIARSLLAWAEAMAAYLRGQMVEPDIRQLQARGKLLGSGLVASLMVLPPLGPNAATATASPTGPRRPTAGPDNEDRVPP